MTIIHVFECFENDKKELQQGEKYDSIEFNWNQNVSQEFYIDEGITKQRVFVSVQGDFGMPHHGNLYFPHPNKDEVKKEIPYELPQLKILNFKPSMNLKEIMTDELKDIWEKMPKTQKIFLYHNPNKADGYLELEKAEIKIDENRPDGYLYIYKPSKICFDLVNNEEFVGDPDSDSDIDLEC